MVILQPSSGFGLGFNIVVSLVIPPLLVCFSCQRLSFFLTTIDSACPTPCRLTTRGGRAVFITFCNMQYFRYARLTTRSSFAPIYDGYRTRTISCIGCVEVFLHLSFVCSSGFLSSTSASASLVSFRLPNCGHLFFFFICVCTSRFLRRYSVILPLGARPLCCILTAAGAVLP